MCSMDVNPMDTVYQRDRRVLEIARYPQLDGEIIRRTPAWCQHMTDVWQSLVLEPLAERLVPARTRRPAAFCHLWSLGAVRICCELGKFGHGDLRE